MRDAFGLDGGADVVGHRRTRSGGGPRPSMTTSHRTSSGNAPARPIAWPPPNECAITPTGAADHVADQQREVEVQQRPREAGVERSAVAVTAEVERDRVVAERGDTRREVVEHAAVVVGAVQEQHRRCGRVAPAPQPQGRAVDLDELGPIGFAQDERGLGAVRDRCRLGCVHDPSFDRLRASQRIATAARRDGRKRGHAIARPLLASEPCRTRGAT